MRKGIVTIVTTNNHSKVAWVTCGAILCYFMFGYHDALRGATLPYVMEYYGINLAQGGSLLLLNFIGVFLASIISGTIADVIRSQYILAIASVLLVIGTVFYMNQGYIFMLHAGMFFIGFALGSYELGGNYTIVDIFPQEKRARYLNIIAAAHSAGALTAPLIFSRHLVQSTNGYETVYFSTIPASILLAIFFLAVRYPSSHSSENRAVPVKELLLAVFQPNMFRFYAWVTLYMSCEIAISSWLVIYLTTQKGYSSANATMILSLFFVFIGLGRLLGSFFIDRFGYRRSLLVAFGGAFILIGAGILIPGNSALLLVLSGSFLSIILPTVIATVSLECKKNLGVSLGALFTFVGIGGMSGSFLVGQVSQRIGITAGLGMTVFLCAIGFTMVLFHQNRRLSTESS